MTIDEITHRLVSIKRIRDVLDGEMRAAGERADYAFVADIGAMGKMAIQIEIEALKEAKRHALAMGQRQAW